MCNDLLHKSSDNKIILGDTVVVFFPILTDTRVKYRLIDRLKKYRLIGDFVCMYLILYLFFFSKE